MSELYTLQIRDFTKGLAVAIFSAIIMFLYTLVTSPDFAFSMITLDAMGNVAFISAISYLFKNYISDSEGKLGGVI